MRKRALLLTAAVSLAAQDLSAILARLEKLEAENRELRGEVKQLRDIVEGMTRRGSQFQPRTPPIVDQIGGGAGTILGRLHHGSLPFEPAGTLLEPHLRLPAPQVS